MSAEFSDKPSKFPWGAVIVGIAAVLFGCIIVAAIVGRTLISNGSLSTLTGGTPSSTTTPAAPVGSVAIDVASSNTKEDWMNAVVAKFNQEEHKLPDGQLIFVRVQHVTSGGSQTAILGGKSQPTVWSPGDQSWVDGANQVWQDRNGKKLIPDDCTQTVLAPIGFAMWRPMAEALGWPDKPIGWSTLVELSSNADGWASLGHPEWGQFKFGHTHPDFSNSGLLIMTALAYAQVDQVGGLKADQVYAPEVVEAFKLVEQNTYHYGIQSRPLMQLLAKRGPDYLHAVNTSEAETLKTNAEFKDQLRFPLAFIFPADGTYWSEHPYCILAGDWVSSEQTEAAKIFRDYLLASEQQNLAVTNYVRPVDASIQLHAPLDLDNGTDPRVTRDLVPALESPSADVASAVKDVFHQTKKKATIILVIDTSGSMEGDKIKAAADSSVTFVESLAPDDQVYAYGFGGDGQVYPVGEGGRAGDKGEALAKSVGSIYAAGNTPLYDAVCTAAERLNELKAADEANGERRLYGIVVLSDGEDTASTRTENQMFNCLPTGESVESFKVFTIAYGEDANADLMLRIANRTNGKTFKGDPDTITTIYNSISAEQ